MVEKKGNILNGALWEAGNTMTIHEDDRWHLPVYPLDYLSPTGDLRPKWNRRYTPPDEHYEFKEHHCQQPNGPPTCLPPKVQTTDKRFTIRSYLEKGGMGMLYVAQDHECQDLAVIKALPDHRKDDWWARECFANEEKVHSRLSGTHIVSYRGSCPLVDGTPAYAMEFVAGPDLHLARRAFPRVAPQDERWPYQYISRNLGKTNGHVRPPLRRFRAKIPPLEFTASAIIQIAHGLDEIHRQGVIHRDIKPENIFLHYGQRANRGDFIVKIGDFGIAAIPHRPGVVAGTPQYLAPEVLLKHDPTTASDFYSLGVVMYYLLTGVQPFNAQTKNRSVWKQLHGVPPRPTALSIQDIPPQLEEVCLTLLQKTPGLRCCSGHEIALAVRDAFPPETRIPLAGATYVRTVDDLF